MTHDYDPYDVRPEVARRALAAPDQEPRPTRDYEPVPGGHGVVPVIGSPDAARERWVIEGTGVTVADLRAAADLIAGQGLGWLAGVAWVHVPTFDGLADAWGPTPEAAVDHLVATLGAVWPDVRAAAADPMLDEQWVYAEQRYTAAGLRISAPRKPVLSEVLWTRRAYLDLRLHIGRCGPHEWVGALREAAAVDPQELLAAFAAAHAANGRPGAFEWSGSQPPVLRLGNVRPGGPLAAPAADAA